MSLGSESVLLFPDFGSEVLVCHGIIMKRSFRAQYLQAKEQVKGQIKAIIVELSLHLLHYLRLLPSEQAREGEIEVKMQ